MLEFDTIQFRIYLAKVNPSIHSIKQKWGIVNLDFDNYI